MFEVVWNVALRLFECFVLRLFLKFDVLRLFEDVFGRLF